MIVRMNKLVDDNKKQQQRKLRDFDKLMDYMTEQYTHRAIIFDPKRDSKRI
jgi:hypothetical protein